MPPIPTPFQATAPVEAARGLDHWEHLTRAALNAHRDGRLEIALAGHVRALWTAEARVDGPLRAMRPTIAWPPWSSRTTTSPSSTTVVGRCRRLGWLRAHGEEPAVEAALHATPAPAFGHRPVHLH